MSEDASSLVRGSATVHVNVPPGELFDAVADISRMGEWSPECVSGRWLAPAAGPAVGAEFEGDNVAKLGPITLKRWTTTSRVTACVRGEVFEFVAEGYSTWRYEFVPTPDGTQLTECYSYPPYTGAKKFFYETIGRRSASMVAAVESTLARIKASVEAAG